MVESDPLGIPRGSTHPIVSMLQMEQDAAQHHLDLYRPPSEIRMMWGFQFGGI